MWRDSRHQLVLVSPDTIVQWALSQLLQQTMCAAQVLTVRRVLLLLRLVLWATIKNGQVKENAQSVLRATTVYLVRDLSVQLVTYVNEAPLL